MAACTTFGYNKSLDLQAFSRDRLAFFGHHYLDTLLTHLPRLLTPLKDYGCVRDLCCASMTRVNYPSFLWLYTNGMHISLYISITTT